MMFSARAQGALAMGECEPRNFLQPCLLLLLRERSDHGYDLVNRLRELYATDGDAGAVYRTLRGLERQGLVRSTWQTSDTGPARRTYQVTALGLASLERHAEVLEEAHRALHLFRERYIRLSSPAGKTGQAGVAGPGDRTGSNDLRNTNGNGSHPYAGAGDRGPVRGPGQRSGR
jgi:poly-beta-hydroxybutyrate-responsive repressor